MDKVGLQKNSCKIIDVTNKRGTVETLTEAKISCVIEEKQSASGLLLATDVAARGLDIPAVEHVIHYQVPKDLDLYIHCSGRTARASREGLSVILVGPEEMGSYKKIMKTLNGAETNLEDNGKVAVEDVRRKKGNKKSKTNKEKEEELEHDLQSAIPKLEEWKSHIVRPVHQDAAKTAAVDALSQSSVLLIMDWAMKLLPIGYRETQRNWFGKKGKSWHITVAINKADSEEIETRTYIHIFDECTQNWFAVASIIEHTLTTLKALKPNLSQVHLRSDNAGCYHCGYLLLSLPSIVDRTGVKITRYNF
ncbi:uncharacterized protein [Pocillopora verrucosa]|uniref:uncharacterized protein isoform X2 n=1 Tax=Pocillopora verrucosa TaxID=203993 RepID=UPI003340F93C